MTTNTSKDRLLDAAEKLFAEHGFDGASVRAITREAGANLAAANYHFGSKRQLLQAVVARRIEPVNRERFRLLDDVERRAAESGRSISLEDVLDAFIRPLLILDRADPGCHFRRLAGRMLIDPGDHLEHVLPQFADVRRRFLDAFAQALPDIDAETLVWRLHFGIGVLCHTLMNIDRLPLLTFGDAPAPDDEGMVAKLVAFLAGGFRAAKLVLVAAILVGLASCSVQSPERDAARIVDEITPPQWTARADVDASEPQSAWWRSFRDTQLDELVDEALRHNRDLFAAAARIDAAALQARLAGAALFPTLDASLDAQRQRQNFIGLPIPGSTGVLSTTNSVFGVSLRSTWEVDLWGRIRAGKRAALADFDAVRDEAAATRLSLAGQVCKAWFAVLEAELQRKVAADSVRSFEKSVEVVRARFEAGQRPAVDLRLAETQLQSAQAAFEQRVAQIEVLRRQLEILLGRYPRGTIEARDDLPEVAARVPAGLPMSLLGRRPDLRAAERRVVAGLERSDEARAALYPRISLSGSAGTSSDSLEDLVDKDFFIWNLAGNLLAPLFRGGQLRGTVELREAQVRERLASFWQLCLRAFAEVEAGLASEAALDRRLVALEDAARNAVASVDLARDRYQNGLAAFTVVLEAQRASLNASSRLLDARRARLDQRVDLYLALGGGFAADTPFLPHVSRSENERVRQETRAR